MSHIVFVHPVSTNDLNAKAQKIKLYPNPARDHVTVEFHGKNAATLVLFNSAGSKVMQSQVHPGTRQVDLSGLNSGMYIYRVERKPGQIQTGKLRLE